LSLALLQSLNHLSGELLEKATRVLTAEEQAVLDQEWVGKDGSKRKLEVYKLVDFYPLPKVDWFLSVRWSWVAKN
jgi:hypothetical protein